MNNMLKKYLTIVSLLFFTPVLFVHAAFFVRFTEFLGAVSGIISIATPIVVGLALLYFFWGLAQFIAKSGNSESHEEGRNKMIWGLIALFVMLTVWGIVFFVVGELGINQTLSPDVTGLSPLRSSGVPCDPSMGTC